MENRQALSEQMGYPDPETWLKTDGGCVMPEYPITPVPKPRMTRSDRWKKRECVLRYRSFCDEVRALGIRLPESGYHVTFVIPMPQSWSRKKRLAMKGLPHQQTPDKDNLEKALLDALYKNDSHIWDGRVTKIWGIDGRIIIEELEEKP